MDQFGGGTHNPSCTNFYFPTQELVTDGRISNGGRGIIETNDSNTAGNGESEGAACIQRSVRTFAHSTQQVPPIRVVPAMEMRE